MCCNVLQCAAVRCNGDAKLLRVADCGCVLQSVLSCRVCLMRYTGHDDTMLECVVTITKDMHCDDDCDGACCSEGFMTLFRISQMPT